MASFIAYLGLVLQILPHTLASTQSLTFKIGPEKDECFYFYARKGQQIEITYQSTNDHSRSNSQINFQLTTVSGSNIISELLREYSSHTVIVETTGDYKACWDNISAYYKKRIFFVVSITNTTRSGADWPEIDAELQTETESYEMKMYEIEASMDEVRSRMQQAHVMQQQLRVFEAADRVLAEVNCGRVTDWSLVQLLVMTSVGLVQVVLVRALFDDRHPSKRSLLAKLVK